MMRRGRGRERKKGKEEKEEEEKEEEKNDDDGIMFPTVVSIPEELRDGVYGGFGGVREERNYVHHVALEANYAFFLVLFFPESAFVSFEIPISAMDWSWRSGGAHTRGIYSLFIRRAMRSQFQCGWGGGGWMSAYQSPGTGGLVERERDVLNSAAGSAREGFRDDTREGL